LKELTVRTFVKVKGEYQLWESLSVEKQRQIGTALNDKALRALGYVPVKKEKNT
jgi:hypothetical protein